MAQALNQHVDFEQFDLITTKSDVGKEKPNGEVYKFALSKIEVSAEKTIAIEDTEINGIDLISWDDSGLITEFKVFIRPLQGVNLIHKLMQQMLENFKNVS